MGRGLVRERQSRWPREAGQQIFANLYSARASCQVQRALQTTIPTFTDEETEAQEDRVTCPSSLSQWWEPGFQRSRLSGAFAFGHDCLLAEQAGSRKLHSS